MSNAYVNLLNAAAADIHSGEMRFICLALERVGNRMSLQQEAQRLAMWVMRLLEGSYTLDNWLHQNIKEARQLRESGHFESFNLRARATRLEWMAWMIKTIESNNGEVPA